MDTTLGRSQSTLASASQTGVKPCQRSCRGLMLYFPPQPQQGGVPKQNGASSWQNREPVCLGLSTAIDGPGLDLKKIHEAREIEGTVDFSVVLGHARWDATGQVLPPGCFSGIEFLRFSKTSDPASATNLSASLLGGEAGARGPEQTTAASSSSGVGNFRLLTSSADANARLSRTWEQLGGIDVEQYVEKLHVQALKNWNSMSKWVRDLGDAIAKPKA